MLSKATKLAAINHHGQLRKRHAGIAIPFITHPIDVMKMLWGWGVGDKYILSAAVLHDTMEDTHLTKEKIAAIISKKTASIVEELTFIPPSKAKAKEAKAAYVATFNGKSIEALVIKLADRVCNVGDFIITDPSYAPIYFHKADPLFEAWRARKDELVNRFGQVVQDKIQKTYDRLVADIGARNEHEVVPGGEGEVAANGGC